MASMGDRRLKRKGRGEGNEETADWLLTYGDMVTLLLAFFVLLIHPEVLDVHRLELILAAFKGLGPLQGGNTLSPGELVELGHDVLSLPSARRGRAFNKQRQRAVSLLQPEIKAKKVRVQEDERGLVITLASDVFFQTASAEIDVEASRRILEKLSFLLRKPELAERTFRIEGHTDERRTDPEGRWPTNWELSVARSVNVLHYLVDLGVDEEQFQVAGFAGMVPLDTAKTPEADAYNRRVDVIVLSEGNL